ncbi:balbiani ring protein 3-like [Portunus trituberculatus]|uniref:balbiani ring protein 3-like n=1 Tax=Portunus trituberculatus TaxID=210409 RepID=UPI001E1CF254|nr:balbiani ring protein 3-like [Portunus trituberculatus]
MKIVLLLTLVVALCHGFTQNCPAKSRAEKKFWYKQSLVTHCNRPTDSLVQLKVPDGYDYVKPSVVKINQCSGLFCSEYPMKCVARSFQTKTVQVEAFRRVSHSPTCVNVSVEEHTACGCSCDRTTCETNEVFDDETCSCVCDPRLKSQCDARLAKNHEVRWSERACACLCIHLIDCGSSMEWNQWLCRCDPKQ